jgi:hypothetical protein
VDLEGEVVDVSCEADGRIFLKGLRTFNGDGAPVKLGFVEPLYGTGD